MNTSVFNPGYAQQYDLFYQEKDYEAECTLIEEAFGRYSDRPIHTILDIGCGTGNHAFPLLRRGYRVTGVDLSEAMLALAEQKALRDGRKPDFIHGDARSFDLGRKYDAAIMMFAVLGYQLPNEDVRSTLRAIRKHLHTGGVFVFDVWYGPAVLSIRPSDRIKVIPTDKGQVIRAASGSLQIGRHLSKVKYHIWEHRGNQVVADVVEEHCMRYFFPQELALFLEVEQFNLVNLSAFGNLDEPAGENTWNIQVVAKAI